MSVTRIYLVRHGEAEGNLYRRMQGAYNSDLTELGYRQVEAVGRRFREIPLDGVYASDLYRAMYTASALCIPKGLPLHTDERLREVCVGPWEDKPFGTAWRINPREMEDFVYHPDLWRLEGAETFRQVGERGCQALREIVRANPGKTLAVCAHSYLIAAVLCGLVYGYENRHLAGRSDNTAVSLLEWDKDSVRVVFQNDSSHLDGLGLRRTRWRPESGSADLHIAPMGGEIEQYIRYRKDAWQVVYGDLMGFDGSGFWMDAQRTMGPDPEAMVVGYLDQTPVGMIQLSPERDQRKHVGYIPFLYLREEFRHKGLGIQLVGHSVSFYRKLGRKKLQLSVAHTNEKAIGFYHKFGFYEAGKTPGRFGKLILMEKNIELPRLPRALRVLPKNA